MYVKERYNSLGQRIAVYYLLLLKPIFNPVRGAYLSCYKDIYDFFHSLYLMFYENPEKLGIPSKQDNCLDHCITSELRKSFLKDLMQIFHIFHDLLYFLYQAGYSGHLQGHRLIIELEVYDNFYRDSRRIKEHLLMGLSLIGLEIRVTGQGVELSNKNVPEMIDGLHLLASMCKNHQCENGFFYFYRCDFDVLSNDYSKLNSRILAEIIKNEDSYRYIKKLRDYMTQNGYNYGINLKNPFRLIISCSNPKIKRTPLLEFTFDIRYESMLHICLRFVSTHKIVPFLDDVPSYVKKDFSMISNLCRGESCMQHLVLKGNAVPSVLKTEHGEKTICWRLQSDYTDINLHNFKLIRYYLLLHQRLLHENVMT